MLAWLWNLLVILMYRAFISTIRFLVTVIIQLHFASDLVFNCLVMPDLLLKTLIRFILFTDLIHAIDIPASFAFPNVVMEQWRYPVICQLLVIAVSYLILLSVILIWEVNSYDVSNFWVYQVKVFADLVQVIEEY